MEVTIHVKLCWIVMPCSVGMPTFQRTLLPPSWAWGWRQQGLLKSCC